jgi:hypothetical protein
MDGKRRKKPDARSTSPHHVGLNLEEKVLKVGKKRLV